MSASIIYDAYGIKDVQHKSIKLAPGLRRGDGFGASR
jgi:hypothetical protein